MARYIAFVMECELKKNIPQQVVDTLKFLVNLGAYAGFLVVHNKVLELG